jgi:HD superfamily phosphohydrolase
MITMVYTELPIALEIKDSIHGYIGVTEIEQTLLDLRHSQRLRNIHTPAGTRLVYPGADSSLMGAILGVVHMTGLFARYLGGDTDEVQKARLGAFILTLAKGPWSNVMEEYLQVRGLSRARLAELIITSSKIKDVLSDNGFSPSEISEVVTKGASIKGLQVNLLETPINPELIESLDRDSYFTGVDYAQIEYHRLFDSTRVAKNKIALKRDALYTLESYLSAGLNMFDAVYYHKTCRAANLMLLRILDLAGTKIMTQPSDDIDTFLTYDDLTFHHILRFHSEVDAAEVQEAGALYDSFCKRYLLKRASSRSISDKTFLSRISTPDGLFAVESEVADDAGIDASMVYVDYPNRPSVPFYPGKHRLEDLAVYERGSRGYEFWPVTEMSLIARSFGRDLKRVRVYTTRGYRSKVKKVADQLLESLDAPGSA